MALPLTPTSPMSRSTQPLGKGLEVTVNATALLSFIVGATATNNGPDAAPAGIVITIAASLQELIVTAARLSSTTLPLGAAPNPEPLMVT